MFFSLENANAQVTLLFWDCDLHDSWILVCIEIWIKRTEKNLCFAGRLRKVRQYIWGNINYLKYKWIMNYIYIACIKKIGQKLWERIALVRSNKNVSTWVQKPLAFELQGILSVRTLPLRCMFNKSSGISLISWQQFPHPTKQLFYYTLYFYALNVS